ncbi:MAG: hypothetical protein GXY83_07540 [Rhodopirellula sp.]|nr:hypothetical protein [Rhodopirellula sp.]
MEPTNFDEVPAESLARMLDPAGGRGQLWERAEMAAILEHQLAAPLADDLGTVDPNLPVRLPNSSASQIPLVTFRDLFHHPEPPVELLDLTKRFAKRCRTSPDAVLPVEIATLLYFLAIAVARFRLTQQISGLDDESLRGGICWSLEQPWLDDETRKLLRLGLDSLG